LKILGDYGWEAPLELLIAKKGAHPTERASLFGKRLVSCNESEEGQQVAEALVKALTGGNRICARRMNEDFWEFDPTHKIILATNHRPQVRGTDHAIWRRIKLVPFDVIIPDDEQDKKLDEKLAGEYPGILRWLVAGCLDWQRDGLGTPNEVLAATKKYRHDEDVFAKFVDACCVENGKARVPASALLKAYKDFTGHDDMNATEFSKLLTDRGYYNDRFTAGPNKGRMGWWGIGLRDDDHEGGEG
jgi:putative DNA primase/helicase